MTQEDTIKFFGNTQFLDETIEETLSKKYIDDYLKSSNLYLGCSDHRRKTLIEVDLYRLQEAFEDGFKAAVELYKQNKNNEY
jgi:hypothetical protein